MQRPIDELASTGLEGLALLAYAVLRLADAQAETALGEKLADLADAVRGNRETADAWPISLAVSKPLPPPWRQS